MSVEIQNYSYSCLNPWNYSLSRKSTTTAVVAVALGAIAVSSDLSSYSILGGTALSLGLAWMFSKSRSSRRVEVIQNAPLCRLPDDILAHILNFLPEEDVVSCMIVSKKFTALPERNPSWLLNFLLFKAQAAAKRIKDYNKREEAHKEIVDVQISQEDYEGAMRTARKLVGCDLTEIYTRVATVQAFQGDYEGAMRTASKMGNNTFRVRAHRRIQEIFQGNCKPEVSIESMIQYLYLSYGAIEIEGGKANNYAASPPDLRKAIKCVMLERAKYYTALYDLQKAMKCVTSLREADWRVKAYCAVCFNLLKQQQLSKPIT